MEEKNKHADKIMEQMLNAINQLTDSYIGEPDTVHTRKEISKSIDNIVALYQNALNSLGYSVGIQYPDMNSLEVQFNPIQYETECVFSEINEETLSKTGIVKCIEEKVEDYILSHFDKWYIKEQGTYIYQIIEDIVSSTIQDVIEKDLSYDEKDEEKIFDMLYSTIDFEYFYELVEDISKAPVTMQEKLADLGMSEKDFL